MFKTSLEQMKERCKSVQTEKSSLEQMTHSLRTDLDRERAAKTELQARRTELESGWSAYLPWSTSLIQYTAN